MLTIHASFMEEVELIKKGNMNCTICKDTISKSNNTKEHIIPSSIGGRKKISSFICRNCNSTTGASWDAELAKQLKSLCLICNISRDRGVTPPVTIQTTKGETVKYHAGGIIKKDKPSVSEKRDGNLVSISIQARDKEEAKIILRKKKKKFPKLDMKEALAQIEEYSSSPDDLYRFKFNFGNESSMKSAIKSLLATISDMGINPNVCELAINFLDCSDTIPIGYYYEQDLIQNRVTGIPIHCFYVKGCKNKKTITGYVELFGSYRMVSLLSSNYIGEDFEHHHALDPISGKEQEVKISLDLNKDEIIQGI